MRVPAGAVDIVMVIREVISARAGRGADGRLFVEPCQDWQRRNAKATAHTRCCITAGTRRTHVLHQDQLLASTVFVLSSALYSLSCLTIPLATPRIQVLMSSSPTPILTSPLRTSTGGHPGPPQNTFIISYPSPHYLRLIKIRINFSKMLTKIKSLQFMVKLLTFGPHANFKICLLNA